MKRTLTELNLVSRATYTETELMLVKLTSLMRVRSATLRAARPLLEHEWPSDLEASLVPAITAPHITFLSSRIFYNRCSIADIARACPASVSRHSQTLQQARDRLHRSAWRFKSGKPALHKQLASASTHP